MPSVVAQTPFNEYVGNGSATVYPYEFQLLSAGDLVVTVAGVDVPSSDYSLTGVGVQSGGNLTFDTAPANGAAIILKRVIALSRDTDYQYNGDLQESTLDRDFNRLWQKLQEFEAQMGGSLRAPYPEQMQALPSAANRALTVQAYDASGQPTVQVPTSGSAADVLLQFANSTDATKGPSLVAYNPALSYVGGLGEFLGYFFGRTESEIDAGVTPSNYAYPPHDIRRYGAAGDGITDDAPAAQLAISVVAEQENGVVVFPAGLTYLLDSSINVCDNLTIWAYGAKIKLGSSWAGINNSLFKNFSGISRTAPGTRLASQNVAFLGLDIDGQDVGVPAALVPDANVHGAIICLGGWTADTGVDGVVVRDCNMRNFAGPGVMLWKSRNIDIKGNRFKNFFANQTLSVGSAIDLHECSDGEISGNKISHDASGLSWHGVVILDWDAGCTNITVTRNIITDMNGGDGISCEGNGGADSNIENGIFELNTIINVAGQGIGLDGCKSVKANRNIMKDVGGPGILATGTPEVEAIGNTIERSGLGGIVSLSGTTRAKIRENTIDDITYTDANYRGHGIVVVDGTLTAGGIYDISANTIKNVDGAGVLSSAAGGTVDDNNVYNAGRSASNGDPLRVGILAADGLSVSGNDITSTGTTHYAISSGSSDFPGLGRNTIRGTFLTAYYYIGFRGTAINHNISVTIEDAQYNQTTNVFTGRYPGTPPGYWYVGDIFFNTVPTAGGFIGSVCTVTGTTWKTFGAISA